MESKAVPSPESDPKILSFEEFHGRTYILEGTAFPTYNNFFVHFSPGMARETYRSHPYFPRFLAEHPELDKSLNEKVPNMAKMAVGSPEMIALEKELYEAYKIMRGYGASDKELFT